MSREYKIFGDYGYQSETLLNDGMSLSESIRWAVRYASSEAMGGYEKIEVAYFAEDGEYVTEHTIHKESY